LSGTVPYTTVKQ